MHFISTNNITQFRRWAVAIHLYKYHNDLTCIFLLRGSFKMEVCKVFWSRHSMTSSAVVCLDREAPRDFFTEWVSTAFIPQSIGLKSTAAILLNIPFMIHVVYVQCILQGCNNDYHGFHETVIKKGGRGTERERWWEKTVFENPNHICLLCQN